VLSGLALAALAVNIGMHSCKHCCQSMTLAHLTSKIRNCTYVHIATALTSDRQLRHEPAISANSQKQ